MKHELSKADKNWIDWSAKNDPVIKWIRNKNAVSFQPGDILIKEEKAHDNTWSVVPISYKSKVAKKYVFMYEDEYGIGYVKQLKAESADYVHNIICLASIDHDRIRFQVDPEYATHMLINGDGAYDHSVEYKLMKERREKVRQENLKLLVKPQQHGGHLDDIFQKMNVGDKFWAAEDIGGTAREEFEVTDRKDHKASVFSGGQTVTLTVKSERGAGRLIDITRFHGYVFKSKPWKLEDMM